jgi:hypothetical protein
MVGARTSKGSEVHKMVAGSRSMMGNVQVEVFVLCCSLGEHSEIHGWHQAGDGWTAVCGLSPLLHQWQRSLVQE